MSTIKESFPAGSVTVVIHPENVASSATFVAGVESDAVTNIMNLDLDNQMSGVWRSGSSSPYSQHAGPNLDRRGHQRQPLWHRDMAGCIRRHQQRGDGDERRRASGLREARRGAEHRHEHHRDVTTRMDRSQCRALRGMAADAVCGVHHARQRHDLGYHGGQLLHQDHPDTGDERVDADGTTNRCAYGR